MATLSTLKRVVGTTTVLIASWALVAAPAKSAPEPNHDAAAAAKSPAEKTTTPDGQELFQREWIANDPRSHGGDGLGPVYNDTSCIACHNLGGSGGGGPASKNVDIITAFTNPTQPMAQRQETAVQTLPGMIVGAFVQGLTHGSTEQAPPQAGTLNVTVVDEDAASDSTHNSTDAPSTANVQATAADSTQQPASTTVNATVVAATPGVPQTAETHSIPASTAASGKVTQQPNAPQQVVDIKKQKAELAKIHPGFLTARSVVLHRFSTDEKYEPWRMQMLGLGQNFAFDTGESTVNAFQSTATCDQESTTVSIDKDGADCQCEKPAMEIHVVSDVDAQQKMQQLKVQTQANQLQGLQGQMGNFSFVRSRRNPTALFGVGLIDQIPDQVLIDQAKKQFPGFPEIQGRVAKMKDGKIGRFGWKDQKATLYEFAMTACAVELGLDVPDQPQAGLPLHPNYKPKGHDMNQAECDALVAYLRNLPAPTKHKPVSKEEAEILSAGEKQFAAVGCADCHAAQLGSVAGIYSDLLLHDMGPELGDSGNYGVFVPDSPEEEQQDEAVPSLTQAPNAGPTAQLTKEQREKTFGALRQEWRTPPLWGVRDSGPYLHDGRAETLEQAIAFHGGEAANSAKAFFMLGPQQRAQVITFLKSLTAPEQDRLASAQ